MSDKQLIIGVTGLIGSGKDTLASYLVDFHGFRKMSFAQSLKDTVAAVFGWDREMLEGTTQRSRVWREQVDQWWAQRLGMPHLTPRWVLQHWGTEVCRQGFHNDIWVASLEAKIASTTDNIVITDARFPNELTAIQEAGGVCVRIHRGADPDWLPLAHNYARADSIQRTQIESRLHSLGIHASEYSSVGLAYDAIIDNNGTVLDLHTQAQALLSLAADRPEPSVHSYA